MPTQNLAHLPLRPLVGVYASAGHYRICMTADTKQAPFCTITPDGTAQLTKVGSELSQIWHAVHDDYDNIVLDTLTITPNSFTCLVYTYTDACDEDHDMESAEDFYAENADTCPCCAALHAEIREFPEVLNDMHTYYEFHGSIGEFVEDLRTAIPRTLNRMTGQRGQQFWADITVDELGDGQHDFEPERIALRAQGHTEEESYNQYDRHDRNRTAWDEPLGDPSQN